MTSVLLVVFIFGLLVPLIASRFGKFLPTDPGTALAYMWHRPHFPKAKTIKYQRQLRRKWAKILTFGVIWGLVLASLSIAVFHYFPLKAQGWVILFLCFMALLTAIDEQFFLLPDVFTVPLLLIGFAYSLWGGQISPQMSILGALYGYLLPTISVLIVHPFIKESFGGGDVKMLAALGAWVGVIPLTILLLISVVSFLVWAILTHKRAGAYGPHLALGAVIVIFLLQLEHIPFL